MILYLSRFSREYRKLPERVKQLAEKREKIFRENPLDPRLKTHKLHGPLKEFWASSIDNKYRIIFDSKDKDTVRFYSVGDHSIYD